MISEKAWKKHIDTLKTTGKASKKELKQAKLLEKEEAKAEARLRRGKRFEKAAAHAT